MSKLKHAAPSSSKRFLIDTTARNPVAQGFSQSNIFSNMGNLAAESRGNTGCYCLSLLTVTFCYCMIAL